MIHSEGSRHTVSGTMTFASALELLEAGEAALASDGTVFDLAAVTEVDSASLAVVFAWLRAAQQKGYALRIEHAPKEMLSLAEVYGVRELLPLA